MNGVNVTYQFYKSNKRSFITIPVAIAKGLNWKNKDKINLSLKLIGDKHGIFLYKTGKEDISNYLSMFIQEWEYLEKNLRKILVKHKIIEINEINLSFHQFLKIVKENKLVNDKEFEILNNLRLFRNYLIHEMVFPETEILKDLVEDVKDINYNIEEKLSLKQITSYNYIFKDDYTKDKLIKRELGKYLKQIKVE